MLPAPAGSGRPDLARAGQPSTSMATPLSAPCLGQRRLSGGSGSAPAMATPASAPGQLQVEHPSPPSVGSPAALAGTHAAAAGSAHAARPFNLDGLARRLEKLPMQQGRASEPGSDRLQHAKAEQQWRCTRCRKPLPSGTATADACKCGLEPPAKRVSVRKGVVWSGCFQCIFQRHLPTCIAG